MFRRGTTDLPTAMKADLGADERESLFDHARAGGYTRAELAELYGVDEDVVWRLLAKKHPEREAVVKAEDRRKRIRLAIASLVIAAVLLLLILAGYVVTMAKNDDARAGLVTPSKMVSAEPGDTKEFLESRIEPVRVEIHRDAGRPSLIGRHSDFSLLIYFRVLLPAGSTAPVESLDWRFILPAGATAVRSWHDQRWNQEPNEEVELVFDDGAKSATDGLLLRPHDFGIHRLQDDGESRAFRVLQYGLQIEVPAGFAIGNDADRGLSAQVVALRWSPVSKEAEKLRGVATLDLAGNRVSEIEGPFQVELVACAECFVLSAGEESKKTSQGLATANGNASEETTLNFSAQNYPWAWIVAPWFRGIVGFLAVALAGVCTAQVRTIRATRADCKRSRALVEGERPTS